jgi:hypothetical protein
VTTPWYPIPDPTSDVVDREAAWLATSGDGGPALLAADSGPWDNVQAYWPGNRLRTQERGVYVTRKALSDDHPTAQRFRPQYQFILKVVWPVKQNTTPLAETEQRSLDAAIGLLLQRIRGPVGDKTHGSRFLSVAEVPEEQPVHVEWDDPELTIAAERALRATLTYYADEIEFNG